MKKVLYIAAGGGGDALSALALASGSGTENLFASFSWDRKMYDPDPGPRSIDDFEAVERVGKYNAFVSGKSALKKKEAKSFLPLIAEEFHTPFLLLELCRILGRRMSHPMPPFPVYGIMPKRNSMCQRKRGRFRFTLAISLHDALRSSILWTVSRSCLVSLP